MPYVDRLARGYLDPKALTARTPGELNFQLTTLCTRYIREKGVSYSTYNEVIGVLECAKLELYRNPLSRYEDRRREENGDVY